MGFVDFVVVAVPVVVVVVVAISVRKRHHTGHQGSGQCRLGTNEPVLLV